MQHRLIYKYCDSLQQIIYVQFSQKWARVTFGLGSVSKLNLGHANFNEPDQPY